jgi:hypothetical protein
MIKHSDGYMPGDPEKHSFIYSRLNEINENFKGDSNSYKKLPIVHLRKKYQELYLEHKYQILSLFQNSEKGRFFSGDLYDKNVYEKIAKFFNLKLQDTSLQHSHKSPSKLEDILNKFSK